MATKDLGEIKVLPLTAVHPHPKNPRTELRHIDELASEMKKLGQQDLIKVCPHPDLDGEYLVLGGHRRYQAALRADMGTIECRVMATPSNVDAEMFAEALTTGRNHSSLTTEEQGLAIQGLLTEGKSEAWIARNFNLKKDEVRPRAALGTKPKVAQRFDRGGIDLLAVAKLQELEDTTGDTSLVEKVVERVATDRDWITFDAGNVERIIADEEHKAADTVNKARLDELQGVKLASEDRYNGQWKITEAEMTEAEHIAAGHNYALAAGGVEWWEKTHKPKKVVSPERKAELELIRTLNNNLPTSKRARRAFTVANIQDKQALTDGEDREIMASLIFDREHFTDDAARLIGEVISVPFPVPADDEESWNESFHEKRRVWKAKAPALVAKLTLGQQTRLLAACQAASVEEQSWRTNLYMRSSWEKENTWDTMSTWYNRLIKFFGFTPDETEVDAIKWAAKAAGAQIDVEIPGLTDACQSCGTAPFEPTGQEICTGCAEGSEVQA